MKNFPRPVGQARAKERQRRLSQAQSTARTLLTEAHREEYDHLYLEARRALDADCGPLPGDPCPNCQGQVGYRDHDNGCVYQAVGFYVPDQE